MDASSCILTCRRYVVEISVTPQKVRMSMLVKINQSVFSQLKLSQLFISALHYILPTPRKVARRNQFIASQIKSLVSLVFNNELN